MSALVKAQAEIKNMYPSSKGYGYDYVPLEKIIDMLKEILPKHGLSYIQLPEEGESTASGVMIGLSTMIVHESGEWIESTAKFPLTDMKGVNKSQAAGAAITYFRRYGLCAAFGITGDKDVDANDKAFKAESASAQNAVESIQKLQGFLNTRKDLPSNWIPEIQKDLKNRDAERISKWIDIISNKAVA